MSINHQNQKSVYSNNSIVNGDNNIIIINKITIKQEKHVYIVSKYQQLRHTHTHP